MTRFITLTAAALTATSLFSAPAQAEIETLEECINAVITWCEENHPNHDCSQSSGLSDCEKEFGNESVSFTYDKIKALSARSTVRGVQIMKSK